MEDLQGEPENAERRADVEQRLADWLWPLLDQVVVPPLAPAAAGDYLDDQLQSALTQQFELPLGALTVVDTALPLLANVARRLNAAHFPVGTFHVRLGTMGRATVAIICEMTRAAGAGM